MKKYRSKITVTLTIFVTVILGIIEVLMIYEKMWGGFIISLLVMAFVVYIFGNTYYLIQDNTLKIKRGFLFNKSIDILSIKKISETNNAIGATSASSDRLKIFYNSNDTALISPKNKSEFIDQITALNPSIKYKLRIRKRYRFS
jgi:hypothetical protein